MIENTQWDNSIDDHIFKAPTNEEVHYFLNVLIEAMSYTPASLSCLFI